jgi:FkbM family methyltransferase
MRPASVLSVATRMLEVKRVNIWRRNAIRLARRHPLQAFRILLGRVLNRDAVVECDGIRLQVGTHLGEGAICALQGRGYEEIDRFLKIARQLPADSLFFDVGANVGTYAIRVAKQAPQVRVCAIEALPRNRDRIRRSAGLNGCTVEIPDVAISETEGEARIPLESKGRASILASNAAEVVIVKTATIDALVAGRAPTSLRLLKVDVDCMCLSALKGGLQTLSMLNTVIYFENDPGVPQFLRKLGYRVGCYTNGEFVETDKGWTLWALPPETGTLCFA